MSFGLEAEDIALIRSVFGDFPGIAEVRIFGSRAMGTHRPNSDIDLAVFGDLDFRNLASLRGRLEDLPLPYKFDVVVYDHITHPPFKDHIDRRGVDFWSAVRAGEATTTNQETK